MNIIETQLLLAYTVFLRLNKDNKLRECNYFKSNPTLINRAIHHFLKIHSSKSNDVEYLEQALLVALSNCRITGS